MNPVQDEIFAIIAQEAGIDRSRITLKSTLHDLQIESLSALEILFELEERFGISLPEQDPSFDTGSVKGLVNAVQRLIAEKGAPTAATG
jgi:acyl carrier protein